MYPNDPPLNAQEFDYRDRDHLAAMYNWAESSNSLSEWLAAQGAEVSPGTLNKWRKRHSIPIAKDEYRHRSDPAQTLDPQEARNAARELLAYLSSREVPQGVPPKAQTGGKYGRALIGGDLHYPHHHERALEIFLGLVDYYQPEEVILNGDSFDFSQLGRYPRNPSAYTPLQDDIDGCRERVLARIKDVSGDANCRMVMGNHELDRWMNYLWTRAPDLASLRCLDLEQVLGLAEMGWIWEPDGFWLTEEFIIDHGERHTNTLGGGSAQSARKEMLDVGTNGLTNHTHHGGQFYRRDARGYRVWAEGFCLCDQEKMRRAGVMKRKRGPKTEDWHMGCNLVYYEPGGSAFRIVPIPILEAHGRTFAIVDGEEIAA